jgi:nicotinamidase/pyrazinamidase
MNRILVDVDTQADFMNKDGALYVEAPEGTREAIRRLLMEATFDGIGRTYQAVIGSVDSHSHDAWEFQANGGPFPAHCVKGTPGWLRVNHEYPQRTRFVPITGTPKVLVGERTAGAGLRGLSPEDVANEALDGVGIYFEKEVYSLFSNPIAFDIVAALVEKLGGKDNVVFDVIGYCTGGYCVDAAVDGLVEQGYKVRVIEAATAAIGGEDGVAKSKADLAVEWV